MDTWLQQHNRLLWGTIFVHMTFKNRQEAFDTNIYLMTWIITEILDHSLVASKFVLEQ